MVGVCDGEGHGSDYYPCDSINKRLQEEDYQDKVAVGVLYELVLLFGRVLFQLQLENIFHLLELVYN